MPNHVKNVLKFKNLKQEDIDVIKQLITEPIAKDIDAIPTKYAIDFDKIIPEPRTIEECDSKYVFSKEKIESGHTGVECTDDRIWFDWYTWRLKYWSTKWNAYDCSSQIGKSYIILIFSTAWTTPLPIIEKLTLLGYDYELKYADEDLGNNCGKITYSCEQGELKTKHDSELKLKDLYKFAKNLWDKY